MGFYLVIFGILGLLTGIVLLVVGLAGSGKKLTITGSILAGVALFSLIFGIYYSVSSAVSSIKNTFTDSFQKIDSIQRANEKEMALPENVWNKSDSADQFPIISELKSFVPDSEKAYVRRAFFRKFISADFQRYPLVFPIAIHRMYFGGGTQLVDERALMDTHSSAENSVNLVLNITHFTYDKNMVLMKTDDNVSGNSGTSLNRKFILYEFGKAGIFEFKTEKELTDAATKIGYSGSLDFFTVDEYSRKFPGEDINSNW